MGGFSQPMDRDKVMDSTLRLTKLTAPLPGGSIASTWDIRLDTLYTNAQANIAASWHNTPRGDNTLLRVMSKDSNGDGTPDFSLDSGTTYQVQMVDNQATAGGANGLPLFLGGAIDLSSGYQFTTGT